MVVCLENLAAVRAALGDHSGALALLQDAIAIEDKIIGQIFAIGSERHRMAYLNTLRSRFDAFLSLVLLHPAGVEEAATSVLLRRKALAAEALAAQRDAILGTRYPDLQPKLQELVELRQRIARYTFDEQGDRKQLAQWNQTREILARGPESLF